MPFVSMASAKNTIDGSVKKRVLDFLQKLQVDDTLPGLHIEPIENARDRRVRTGRVSDEWRAVLFRMDVSGTRHYVYYGTWHHDEAIKVAQSTVLTINLALGVPEFEDRGLPDVAPTPTAPPAQPAEHTAPAELDLITPPVGEPVPDTWTNHLTDHWTVERLTTEAGIRPAAGTQALAASTTAELNAVINQLPEAQGLVLLGLSNGEALEDIREELGLAPVAETALSTQGLPDDEHLDRALRTSSVGFTFVGDSPAELVEAFESLDIDRWRVFLHPEQRKYVTGRWKGSYRLSGGAGTGKTVVLVHRARHLVTEDPQARVLLTTFTRVLADSLVHQVKRLDATVPLADLGEPGLTVSGIDQVAAKIVSTANPAELEAARISVLGPGGNALTARMGNTQKAFHTAVEISDPDLPLALSEPAFLEQEYNAIVLAQGITEEKTYLRASRQGRGTALNRAARKELWKVFAQFRRTNQINDAVTYPEIAAIATAVLKARAERGEPMPADHVLVDEAQDFHAVHWLLLRALAPDGPDDLFIAEDSHQRIYGQKVPLSRFGIHIRGRSRRLRLNYRTTAENLAFAVSLLDGTEYTDLEDAVETAKDYRSVRSGPAPVVIHAADGTHEYEAAAAHVRAWLDAGVNPAAIAVLVRTKHHADRAGVALAAAEIPYGQVRDGNTAGKDKVSVMSMHSAKGLEFERVVVLGAKATDLENMIGLNRLPETERDDALQRERSLLYVAATRARDELVLIES